MKRACVLGIATAAAAAAIGSAASQATVATPHRGMKIPADKPPSPATWPAYPHFSKHSCWARPFLKGELPSVDGKAPSYAPTPRAHPTAPNEIARRFLARFGDRRYLRSITFSPAPPAVGRRVHVLYAGGHPPADALQAHISVPAADARTEPRHPSPGRNLVFGIADWESQLVGGALRDDFCTAGGAPLISWSALPAGGSGLAESASALEQRFPNPSPAAFRKRVALVGRRYGFRIVSLRLLRPEQIAPLLVVRTTRKRTEFVRDVPRIMDLLNPRSIARKRMAQTFEAFFFAAEDAHGPFTWTQYVSRGESEGGEWAANPCLYPYPVIGPIVRPGSKQASCSGSPLRPARPSPTSLRFSAASNRRFAHEDVQGLIRVLVLPRGARLVAKLPRSAPFRFRNESSGTRFLPGTVVTHRIWIVHEPLRRVVRFMQTHAHPRPRPEARFRGENNGVRLHRSGSYPFPPVPGRSWGRWLTVDMVPLSGGETAVIAQAADGWIHPPPRSALLPAAVKRIDIVSRLGNRHPNVLVHVRRPYDVGSIVALLNGLGLADAEHIACAAVFYGGPMVTLRLRAANGRLLGRASVRDPLGSGRTGPCDPVQLTVLGRKLPPLIGADLLLRLQRMLNIDLAPPLPRDVAACLLDGHGWKVNSGPSALRATKSGKRWTITFHHTGKVTLDRKGPRELERCVRS